MHDEDMAGAVSRLQEEVARLEKIVAALIDHAETANDRLPTDFGVFQMTVLLEDQVRSRTQELNAAIQQLEASNQALSESRAKFHAVFDLMPNPVTLTNWDGELLEISRSFAEFFGYRQAEMVGHRIGSDELALWTDPGDRGRFFAAVEAGLGVVTDFESSFRHKDGRSLDVTISCQAVTVEGERLLVAEFHDVTEAKRQGMQLRTLAEHDSLTGLPNRLLVLDRLQQAMALARRDGSRLAVCYLDLDGFKAVNDQFGHQAGDLVLAETARRLLASVRASDTVARLGGDEFAILLQGGAGMEGFDDILCRILAAIRLPYALDAGRFGEIGASVGFTVFPDDDAEPEVLLNHADQAMYAAKHVGKDCFMRFVAHRGG